MDTLATSAMQMAVPKLEKAILQFVEIEKGEIKTNPSVTPAKSYSPSDSSSFLNTLANTGASAAQSMVAGAAAAIGLDTSVFSGAMGDFMNNDTYVEDGFVVQFNPASIQFNVLATKSTKVNRNPSNSDPSSEKPPQHAEEESFQDKNDANISMEFDLIFNDVNIEDAFLENKLNPFAGDKTFVQSIAQTAVKAADLNKKNYSVREQVQALTYAARNSAVRTCKFSWGKTCFIGNINSLVANYTMFSPKGEPIHAVVTVHMVLAGRYPVDNAQNPNETVWKSYNDWDQIFLDAFGKGGHLKAKEMGKAESWTSKAGSIVNINF